MVIHVLNSTKRNLHVMIHVFSMCFRTASDLKDSDGIPVSSRSQMEIPLQNTIKDSNGELLTGRCWRMNHTVFKKLPFYSDISRMDEIARPLEKALVESSLMGSFGRSLVVRTHNFVIKLPFQVLTKLPSSNRNWQKV
jgi:hypothetical protein